MFKTLRAYLAVSFAALLASSGVYGALTPRSGPVNFTSPVYLITSVACPEHRIGVAYRSHITPYPKPLPIITVATVNPPQENVRWAVGILPDQNYHMHVVEFNAAVHDGSVYAVPPTLVLPQEFNITSYGSNDTFKIEPVGGSGAWTVGGVLGDQLTNQPFEGTPTQLFNIVPYPVASIFSKKSSRDHFKSEAH